MKIKLTKEQVDLLLQGNVLEKNGVIYCHLPYWYKGVVGGDEFEVYHLDKLPEELLDGLIAGRKGDCLYTDTIENCFKNPLTPDECYGEL